MINSMRCFSALLELSCWIDREADLCHATSLQASTMSYEEGA